MPIEEHIEYLLKNPGKWRLIRKRKSQGNAHRKIRQKAYNTIIDMLKLYGVAYEVKPTSLSIRVKP